MATKNRVLIDVQVREEMGRVTRQVEIEAESVSLPELLREVARQPWGERLFEPGEDPVEMRPGHILVLNNRMIQTWEIPDVIVADGAKLNFVPVVAGG